MKKLEELKEKEEALWAEYNKTRSDETKTKLMECYIPMVKNIVYSKNFKIPLIFNYDDLVNFGMLCVSNCIEKYKNEIPFPLYLYIRVKNGIKTELIRTSYFKFHCQTTKRRLRNKIYEIKNEKVIKNEIEINEMENEIEINEMENEIERINSTLYDNFVRDSGEGELDLLRSDYEIQDEYIHKQLVISKIKELMNKIYNTKKSDLSNIEALRKKGIQRRFKVIELYFFENLSYDEIAERMGITYRSVTLLASRGLEELRNNKEIMSLK